LSNEEIDYF